MNKFTQFITGIIAGVTLSTTPVKADTYQDHSYLWDMIEYVGVKVKLNQPDDCKPGVDGVYDSNRGYITICKDNGITSYLTTEWTANDLDTLRHEAQHVIQDCVDNRLGDGKIQPSIEDVKEREKFVVGILGPDRVKNIIFRYRQFNANIIESELEAHAVAQDIDAKTIAIKLLSVCAS